ncbi:hypothetical protein BV898_02090 [Hypsibius exemplaris]|uniref:Uncharacterized protein n=1 Tax=Hypsibius exemplaris TaxID=2072580 RepID=A0A1W0X9R6_HYPEX|nr:hypothetical protein BV898_02090 [Hypsibius exemplaris]
MSDAPIDSITTQYFCNTEFCNGGRNDLQTLCKSTPAPTISAAHLTTSSVAQYPLNNTKNATSDAFVAYESAAFVVLLGFTTILTANFLRG